jgi:hypothetical protein
LTLAPAGRWAAVAILAPLPLSSSSSSSTISSSAGIFGGSTFWSGYGFAPPPPPPPLLLPPPAHDSARNVACHRSEDRQHVICQKRRGGGQDMSEERERDGLLPPSAMQIVTQLPHSDGNMHNEKGDAPSPCLNGDGPSLWRLKGDAISTSTISSGSNGQLTHPQERQQAGTRLCRKPACHSSLRKRDGRHRWTHRQTCVNARQTPPRHTRRQTHVATPRQIHVAETQATHTYHTPPIHTHLPTALILDTSESDVRASLVVSLTTRLKHASERDGKHASIVERDGGGGRCDAPSLSPTSCPHIISPCTLVSDCTNEVHHRQDCALHLGHLGLDGGALPIIIHVLLLSSMGTLHSGLVYRATLYAF